MKQMMPTVTIADPALTLGLPPHVTAATGMDALAHNLEAYCAPFYHPFAKGVAKAADTHKGPKRALPVTAAAGGGKKLKK